MCFSEFGKVTVLATKGSDAPHGRHWEPQCSTVQASTSKHWKGGPQAGTGAVHLTSSHGEGGLNTQQESRGREGASPALGSGRRPGEASGSAGPKAEAFHCVCLE